MAGPPPMRPRQWDACTGPPGTLFSYADIDGPFRKIKVPVADLVERPYLTAEQLAALADELGPEQAAFMWVGVVLGLRWAEVAGLVVADVDALRGTLRVSGQLARNGTRQVTKTRARADGCWRYRPGWSTCWLW